MRVLCTLLYFAVLLDVSEAAHAGPITYQLHPHSDGASELTGWITTHGDLGPIGSGELLAWSFKSTGATVFELSSMDPGVSQGCTGPGVCFTASATHLTYVIDPDLWEPVVWFYDAARALSVEFWPVANLRWGGPATLYWGIGNEWHGREIENPVVATVPEPAPLGLLLFGLALTGGYAWGSVSNARHARMARVLNVQHRFPT